MQFGNPAVVTVQKCQEIVSQVALIVFTEGTHDAEIHHHDARTAFRARLDKDIAGVHVRVEETVPEHLGEENLHPAFSQPFQIHPRLLQRRRVADGDTGYAFHHHHVPARQLPQDLGDVKHIGVGKIAAQLGGRGRLPHQIEFVKQRFFEFIHYRGGFQSSCVPGIAFQGLREDIDDTEIPADHLSYLGTYHLDDHLPAILHRGGVHLRH